MNNQHSLENALQQSESFAVLPDFKEGCNEPNPEEFKEEMKESVIFEEISPTFSKKRAIIANHNEITENLRIRTKRVSEPFNSIIFEENTHAEEDTHTKTSMKATVNIPEPVISKKVSNDLFLVDLDSMKSWVFYFPSNNSEKLIGSFPFFDSKQTTKRIESRKKLRNSMKKRSPASISYQRGLNSLNRWADFSEGTKSIRSTTKKSKERKPRASEMRLDLLNQFHKFVASAQE